MMNNNMTSGLSIDDTYILLHDPDNFILTEHNMKQVYILLQNLNYIFEKRAMEV